MKINIYGVGRSGTKGILLYLSYLILKKEGEIQLNYEPYFHATRKDVRSFRGMKYNISDNQIININDRITAFHHAYLKSLIKKENEMTVITKFIRANGRISKINDVMSPDYNILVVRDLYEVLNSIVIMNWDFYRYGSTYLRLSSISILKRLLEEGRKNELLSNHLYKYLTSLSNVDRILGNALYWYLMNKAALLRSDVDLVKIHYDNLSQIDSYLEREMPQYYINELSILDSKFRGSNIHNDSVISTPGEKTQFWKKASLIDELMFYLGGRAFKNYPTLFNRRVGEVTVLSEQENNTTGIINEIVAHKNTISVQHTSLLNDLNEEIKEMF